MKTLGKRLSITSHRKGPEEATAEIIRHQTTHGKKLIHELGPRGITNQLLWAMKERGGLYQVKWGKKDWITNVKDISESGQGEQKGKQINSAMRGTSPERDHQKCSRTRADRNPVTSGAP